MRKTYMQPHMEVINIELEGVIANVSGVNGLGDVTFSSENPTSFSKERDSFWDEEE
jgi:hypothetical protein